MERERGGHGPVRLLGWGDGGGMWGLTKRVCVHVCVSEEMKRAGKVGDVCCTKKGVLECQCNLVGDYGTLCVGACV